MRTMFAQYIKALLASVAAQQGGPQGRADAYGGHFLLDWSTTQNYRTWQSQIDVRSLVTDATYMSMQHPGTAMNTGPSTLVGKSFQVAKSGVSSLSSTANNVWTTLGNAWSARSYNTSEPWGLSGFNDAPQTPASSAPATPLSTAAQASPSTPASSPYRITPNASPYGATTSTATTSASPPSFRSPSSGVSGFLQGVKSAWYGKSNERAAQFESASLETLASPPVVTQPAQPMPPANHQSGAPPGHSTIDSDEDLLGF